MTPAEQGLSELTVGLDSYTGKTTQKVLEQARGQSGSPSEGRLQQGHTTHTSVLETEDSNANISHKPSNPDKLRANCS